MRGYENIGRRTIRLHDGDMIITVKRTVYLSFFESFAIIVYEKMYREVVLHGQQWHCYLPHKELPRE